MEDECYDFELDDCADYPFDNFGGHTKAIVGFEKYDIEGAEIYHMGQMFVLGSYPIHFHMALDVSDKNPVIKSNSIHDTFSRCVTIHGTSGVRVEDNVAVDHYGHCYFLEDGCEQNTVFDHNLGLGTRKGSLTPSDKEPTTFWFTSPLVEVTNNAAAGSETKSGTGIWYLFPDEPIAHCKGLGIFEKKEAKNTPIPSFYNNAAHSNGNIGLALNKRLGDGHTIIGCSTYTPLVDPKKKNSEYQPVIFDTFHGYKNGKRNVIMRSATTEGVNFFVGDSLRGITLNRNMLGGYQRIRDTTIIGDTPNTGMPEQINVKDPDTGKTQWVWSERSYPWKWSANDPAVGVLIDAEGPSHLENVRFLNFKSTNIRRAAAIEWRNGYM